MLGRRGVSKINSVLSFRLRYRYMQELLEWELSCISSILSNQIVFVRIHCRESFHAAMTSIFLPLTDFHSTANDPTIDKVAKAAAT
jgi:hypothetical protein